MEEKTFSTIHHHLHDVVMEEQNRIPVETCEALLNSEPKKLKKIMVARQNVQNLQEIKQN